MTPRGCPLVWHLLFCHTGTTLKVNKHRLKGCRNVGRVVRVLRENILWDGEYVWPLGENTIKWLMNYAGTNLYLDYMTNSLISGQNCWNQIRIWIALLNRSQTSLKLHVFWKLQHLRIHWSQRHIRSRSIMPIRVTHGATTNITFSVAL